MSPYEDLTEFALADDEAGVEKTIQFLINSIQIPGGKLFYRSVPSNTLIIILRKWLRH